MMWNENSQKRGKQSHSLVPTSNKIKQPPEKGQNLTSILAKNMQQQTPKLSHPIRTTISPTEEQKSLNEVDGVLFGHPQPGALMEVGKKRATLNQPEN